MVAARPLPATHRTPLPLPRLLREPCGRCNGSGVVGALTATCSACGAHETPERLAAHLDGAYGGWWGYRWWLGGAWLWRWRVRLPCGHRLDALSYTQPACPACRGRGTYQHTALRSLRDVRPMPPLHPVTTPAPEPEPEPPTLVLPVLPASAPTMPEPPAVPPIRAVIRRTRTTGAAIWRMLGKRT